MLSVQSYETRAENKASLPGAPTLLPSTPLACPDWPDSRCHGPSPFFCSECVRRHTSCVSHVVSWRGHLKCVPPDPWEQNLSPKFGFPLLNLEPQLLSSDTPPSHVFLYEGSFLSFRGRDMTQEHHVQARFGQGGAVPSQGRGQGGQRLAWGALLRCDVEVLCCFNRLYCLSWKLSPS